MSFEWLTRFKQESEKASNYAEKSLAAYRLGMRAKGSIAGVTIDSPPDCCEAARRLPTAKVYHPDEAPLLPLEQCTKQKHCGCVYRPVMTYQKTAEQ